MFKVILIVVLIVIIIMLLICFRKHLHKVFNLKCLRSNDDIPTVTAYTIDATDIRIDDL